MTIGTAVGDATAELAVRKAVVVNTPTNHAFKVFTERMSDWWPKSHHIGTQIPQAIILEPHPGGRWYERGPDAVECQWGQVLVWSPPERIILGWQLSADWTYDPDFVTEIEIRFIEEGPERTRVEFEHRNLDRYGDRAAEHARILDSPNAWSEILGRFHIVAEGRELPADPE